MTPEQRHSSLSQLIRWAQRLKNQEKQRMLTWRSSKRFLVKNKRSFIGTLVYESPLSSPCRFKASIKSALATSTLTLISGNDFLVFKVRCHPILLLRKRTYLGLILMLQKAINHINKKGGKITQFVNLYKLDSVKKTSRLKGVVRPHYDWNNLYGIGSLAAVIWNMCFY